MSRGPLPLTPLNPLIPLNPLTPLNPIEAADRAPVRRPRRLGLVALVVVTASCAPALDLPDPDPGTEARARCTDLMADLPETVRDEDRREVRPGEFTAAWGDPPITLRCGVSQPPDLTRSSECWEVNGVGWFAEEAEGGMLFTTIGRGTFVEVGVPTAYTPHADALVNFATPIEAHVPSEQPCV